MPRTGGAITRSGLRTGEDFTHATPPQSPQAPPQVPAAPVAAPAQMPNPFPIFHFHHPAQLFPALPLNPAAAGNPFLTPVQSPVQQAPAQTPTGGSQLPMEDNFFFPPRDRDRRYVMENYSRVMPHHKFFGMAS